jgi:hypothetical protein
MLRTLGMAAVRQKSTSPQVARPWSYCVWYLAGRTGYDRIWSATAGRADKLSQAWEGINGKRNRSYDT